MSTSKEKKLTEAEITNIYNQYKAELQALAQKAGELEAEAEEHKLVIDTIAPLDAGRKCFRMVGGVLVERTVKDVLPALQTNFDGVSISFEAHSLCNLSRNPFFEICPSCGFCVW